MQGEINTFVQEGRHYLEARIFGYRSKGIPGIEMVGLGPKSRLIKEKVVYLSKALGVSPRAYRYVFALETMRAVHKNLEVEQCEFALALMYWWLCESVNLQGLSQIWTWGKIDITGQIGQGAVPLQNIPRNQIVVSEAGDDFEKFIRPSQLLKNLKGLQFSSHFIDQELKTLSLGPKTACVL